MMDRWYIIRYDDNGNKLYYAGADSWTHDFSKRYLWYSHKPTDHPVFSIYNGCEIITEGYEQ
jgi:hypothetical protein